MSIRKLLLVTISLFWLVGCSETAVNQPDASLNLLEKEQQPFDLTFQELSMPFTEIEYDSMRNLYRQDGTVAWAGLNSAEQLCLISTVSFEEPEPLAAMGCAANGDFNENGLMIVHDDGTSGNYAVTILVPDEYDQSMRIQFGDTAVTTNLISIVDDSSIASGTYTLEPNEGVLNKQPIQVHIP